MQPTNQSGGTGINHAADPLGWPHHSRHGDRRLTAPPATPAEEPTAAPSLVPPPIIHAISVVGPERLTPGDSVTVRWDAQAMQMVIRYEYLQQGEVYELGGVFRPEAPSGEQVITLGAPPNPDPIYLVRFQLEALTGIPGSEPGSLSMPQTTMQERTIPAECVDAWSVTPAPEWCPAAPIDSPVEDLLFEDRTQVLIAFSNVPQQQAPAAPFFLPWEEGGYRIEPLRPDIGWPTGPAEQVTLTRQCEESSKHLFERCWWAGLGGSPLVLDGQYKLWAVWEPG